MTSDDLDLRRLSQLTAATQGSSALALHDWPEPAPPGAPSAGTASLALVPLQAPPGARRRVTDGPSEPGPSTAELREQARGFAQALVEIITGDRTLTQLVRWTTAEVYEELHHRVHTLATCPLPAAHLTEPRRRRRPRVASVHVSQPSDCVAEVAARVDHGARSTALALRLERRVGARRVCAGGVVRRVAEERWVCTAISWA